MTTEGEGEPSQPDVPPINIPATPLPEPPSASLPDLQLAPSAPPQVAPQTHADAAKTQSQAPRGSEAENGEDAQTATPRGLEAVMANHPSTKGQLGDQLGVTSFTHGFIAASGAVALSLAGGYALATADAAAVAAAAATLAASSPELAAAAAPLLATAGPRAAGGAISGGISAGIASGGDPGQIAQGAVVGGAVGAVNPAGLIGLNPGFFAGGVNALTTNVANQTINVAANGASPSVPAAAISFAGGATFGGWFGSTNAAQLGIPIQGAVIRGAGSGVSGGLVAGATGHTLVNF
jgi:hypothetical protein